MSLTDKVRERLVWLLGGDKTDEARILNAALDVVDEVDDAIFLAERTGLVDTDELRRVLAVFKEESGDG